MLLDRHSQPVKVCEDSECPGWEMDDGRHFDLHNKPCAKLSTGEGGSEVLCELLSGHEGECLPRAG